MSASIKKNTFYNVIKTFSSIVFPLITFPYTSRVLHAENVGKVNFGSSIISYISLIASLGIATYATRECSKVKNDKEKLGNIASQIISINIFSTILAYVILTILLVFWKALDGYKVLIIIQSLSILFTTLGADWLNTAMEDFKYITLRTFLFQILSIAAMFAFVHTPEHYLIYAAISVVSSSGANIANMIYRRRYCKTRFTLNIEWKRHLKPILTLFALYLSQIIYVNVDTTMLGVIKGDYEVGLYSTAVKIYSIVNMCVASIAQVVLSELSFQYSQKKRDYSKINHLLKYSAQFIFTLGFPCVVGLNLLAPEIIEIISGKEYLGAVPALHILTISLLFSCLGGFVGNIILTPQGKDNINLRNCIVSAVLNLILNFIFIPKWGLYAAAATTAASEFVGFCLALPHVEKEVNIGSKLKLLGGPLLGCAFMTFVAFLLKQFVLGLVARTLIIFLSCAAIYFIVLLVCKNEMVMSLGKMFKNKIIKK